MIESKTEAWEHQRAATAKIIAEPAAAIFYGMGAGKSKAVVDAFRNSGLKRLLVLCPSAVIAEWPDQFAKHCADPCPEILALPSRLGPTAKRARLLAQFGDGVVVVNYESAKQGYSGKRDIKGLARALFDWAPEMIVCDESHKIKAHNSAQSKFAWRLGEKAKRRVVLTGTPTPNNPLDLFGQFRFLDDRILGTGWTNFLNRYAVMGGPKRQWVVGFKDIEALRAVIKPFALQVKSEDVLDLPPFQDFWRWAPMPPDLRRKYSALKEDSIAFLTGEDGDVITTSNALVQALRLQQLLSGEVPNDLGERIRVETPKEALLEDIVDGIAPSEPIVCFGNFKADMDMAQRVGEKLKRPVCELSGRAKELDDWCASVDGWTERYDKKGRVKAMPILAVNIAAGGAGINQMVRSRYCIFISTGYSFGNYAQARARLHRPGQERKVAYYHLGVEGTVDAEIAKAIESKAGWAEAILSSLSSGLGARQREKLLADAAGFGEEPVFSGGGAARSLFEE